MLTTKLEISAEDFGIEYIDYLYRYALMLTGRQAEAQDLVQETYVRAVQAFHGLREDSNVRGWLVTILRNVWLNELRKRRRGPLYMEIATDSQLVETLPGNGRDALQMLERDEDVVRIRAAMRKLPLPFQEILVLREFEEHSYQEIAAILNCPAGTVMSRLGRARAKLRALLTEGSDKPMQAGKVGPT